MERILPLSTNTFLPTEPLSSPSTFNRFEQEDSMQVEYNDSDDKQYQQPTPGSSSLPQTQVPTSILPNPLLQVGAVWPSRGNVLLASYQASCQRGFKWKLLCRSGTNGRYTMGCATTKVRQLKEAECPARLVCEAVDLRDKDGSWYICELQDQHNHARNLPKTQIKPMNEKELLKAFREEVKQHEKAKKEAKMKKAESRAVQGRTGTVESKMKEKEDSESLVVILRPNKSRSELPTQPSLPAPTPLRLPTLSPSVIPSTPSTSSSYGSMILHPQDQNQSPKPLPFSNTSSNLSLDDLQNFLTSLQPERGQTFNTNEFAISLHSSGVQTFDSLLTFIQMPVITLWTIDAEEFVKRVGLIQQVEKLQRVLGLPSLDW